MYRQRKLNSLQLRHGREEVASLAQKAGEKVRAQDRHEKEGQAQEEDHREKAWQQGRRREKVRGKEGRRQDQEGGQAEGSEEGQQGQAQRGRFQEFKTKFKCIFKN